MTSSIITFRINKEHPGFKLQCRAEFYAGSTAICGPSGSGKTTLLNCLSGLATPDDGEITILGETVYSSDKNVNIPPEKRQLGYVFQESTLFPHMTVLGNIRYGYGLTPSENRKIDLEQLVSIFDLSGLVDRNVINLSGGERQRVAFARALSTSPKLLLLDEPLASIDLAFKGVVIRYLKRMRKDLDIPIVYVSHSMSEVMALADDALVLSNGNRMVQTTPYHAMVHSGSGINGDHRTFQNLIDAKVVDVNKNDRNLILLVGESCLLTSSGYEHQQGDLVTISIGSGEIIISTVKPVSISARNILPAVINEIQKTGTRVVVGLDIGTKLIADITVRALLELDLRVGQNVYAIVKSSSVIVLDGTPDFR